MESWRLGLKAVAVYRDGCKRSQPLSTSRDDKTAAAAAAPAPAAEPRPARRKLPDERHSLTHKFSIAGHEGYITVGMYEDGKPGEIFLKMAKEGSTISGLMDAFATSISMALQYGVPLEALVEKFSHVRFEPVRLHQERRDPVRQEHHRLHLPVAGLEVPVQRAGPGRRRAGERAHRGRAADGAGDRAVHGSGERERCGRDEREHERERDHERERNHVPQPGRRPVVPLLRQHHDAQRKLLPVLELRVHERVQLGRRAWL